MHGGGRFEILATTGSFHGRTFATLTATGQEKYHRGFLPLLPGVRLVPYDDLDGDGRPRSRDETIAILVEPIQGEGGVVVPRAELPARAARALPTAASSCSILDEIQAGLGRTGRLFAYEHAGIVPDVMTLAKALGGGVPIGAMLTTDRDRRGAHARLARHDVRRQPGRVRGRGRRASATLARAGRCSRTCGGDGRACSGAGLEAHRREHAADRGRCAASGSCWAPSSTGPAAPVVDACLDRRAPHQLHRRPRRSGFTAAARRHARTRSTRRSALLDRALARMTKRDFLRVADSATRRDRDGARRSRRA